ncbi:MAG: hypothetical protein QM572_16130 [Nocardioides sp.]|uniref:hypothetical protein n=1 Tax=Nocardioides sp. TaxID=35761 RepID=UPI0039E3242A
MRTTVDLPPVTHQRARAYAEKHGISLSTAIAESVARGLDLVDEEPVKFGRSKHSGFPTFNTGTPVTHEEVLAFLDEDE